MLGLASVLAVPARPATTAASAGAIGPNAAQLASTAQPAGKNQTLVKLLKEAEGCGLDSAFSAMAKFGVDKCDEIEVGDLPEGQRCEDFYTRQTVFTLCRSRDTPNPSSCERGANFSCWVPGVSNLASAKKAGIRIAGDSADDCKGCLEIGPWLVPPGYEPYPNGPDGQPAVYPEGVCPQGCNPAGSNPYGTNPAPGSKLKSATPWHPRMAKREADATADSAWDFCWCGSDEEEPYAPPDEEPDATPVCADRPGDVGILTGTSSAGTYTIPMSCSNIIAYLVPPSVGSATHVCSDGPMRDIPGIVGIDLTLMAPSGADYDETAKLVDLCPVTLKDTCQTCATASST
jgi:hypothetical protein